MDLSCGVCQQILRGWGDINMQILGLHWWVEAVFGRKNMAVVPYTALTLCYLLLFLRRISELWQHNFKNLPEIQEQLLNRLHATQKVSFTCASSMVEMLDPLHKFGSRFLLRWKTMPSIKGERIFHYQISAGFFYVPSYKWSRLCSLCMFPHTVWPVFGHIEFRAKDDCTWTFSLPFLHDTDWLYRAESFLKLTVTIYSSTPKSKYVPHCTVLSS